MYALAESASIIAPVSIGRYLTGTELTSPPVPEPASDMVYVDEVGTVAIM